MYYTDASAEADGKQGDYLEKLKAWQTLDIDEQAKVFLKAFVSDFLGKFEAVLDMVDEFKSFLAPGQDQLDEQQAHLFLEKKGETHTAVEFREKMRQIDLDFNKRISIIEWLLFKYKKTLKQLCEAKPVPGMTAQLEEAIAKHQAVFKAKKEKAEKIAALSAQVSAGGPGAAKAKTELMRLKSEDPAKQGASEIDALAGKLKAQREAKDPYTAEQRRVAEEKRKKEDEEARKKADSRKRLKDRAAFLKA